MPELSSRALRNVEPNDTWALMGRVFSNPWSESNPDGIVAMGIAENKLMHAEITEYLNSHFSMEPKMLTYGDGPCGSYELRDALAKFVNNNFAPKEQLTQDHVTVMNGVGSVIDAVCFCIAEPGDGILIVRPLYVGFIGDLEARAEVKPVCVSVGEDDVTGLAAVSHHEKALIQAEKNGTKVKGLMLCNPHNPLGRCYSKEVIEAYLALCSKYNIHLISDEVYAKAVFPSKDISNPLPFTSVLSLDIEKLIDPSLVHVLYGMSKDFCSNGLRIGCFISLRNPTLHATMSAVAKFSWASSLSDRAWTLILTNETFLKGYFEEMTRRMTAAYEVCTDILKEMCISYVPANCGPFIWIDLAKFMKERTMEEERKLSWKMINCGVWLATGEAFMSETPGWFRITFAVSETDLRFGIDRLRKALDSI